MTNESGNSQLDFLKEYAEQRYGKVEGKVDKGTIIKYRLMSKSVGNGKIVLDIACGDGILTKMIGDQNNKVIGLDLVHEKLRLIQSSGIECVIANLQGFYLPFRKNSFDVVVASEIIEHMWNCDFFLGEIKRVLKPKGIYVISTPNLASLGRRLMLLLGKNPFVENFLYTHESGHLKHFVKTDLEYLLRKNGFAIKKIQTDVVVFSRDGRLFSRCLAKIFPNLGRCMVVAGKCI